MNYISFASILIGIFYTFNNILVEGLIQRILGIPRADWGRAKYLVAIYQNGQHICGGGIIGDTYILTAAHCVINAENNEFETGRFKIVAGSINLRYTTPLTITVDVKEAYVPNIYNGSFWGITHPKGDIAVLKLENRLYLKQNRHLQKLLLPWEDVNYQPYDNANPRFLAETAGFGDDSSYNYTNSQGKVETVWTSTGTVKRATVLVKGHEFCNEKYGDNYYDSDTLCGRVVNYNDGTPQGTCTGDSGSPLVQRNVTIIGLVSGGGDFCDNNILPSIFTKVESFKKFVENAKQGITNDIRVKKY